jgi:hypothetical protein
LKHMHIGIDFDNTLAHYDHVIRHIACEEGWINDHNKGSKRTIRDAIRKLPDGEQKWMQLQAEIYGPRMGEAKLFDGVPHFMAACTLRGVNVSIISHKTQFAATEPDGTDLRQAALGWMEEQDFFSSSGLGLGRESVHFAKSRAEKCQLITSLKCHLFIDDLPELFSNPEFPSHVNAILLDSNLAQAMEDDVLVCASWSEIKEVIFYG